MESHWRWIAVGVLSGTVAELVFPQRSFGLLPLVLWGAAWGAVLAATLAGISGKRLILAAALFGAALPTAVALLIFAPLRGQPPVTGIVPLAILAAIILNGAWGFATGVGLALFGRR